MLEGILKRALQTVFGGGADINAGNPLQTYDPRPTKTKDVIIKKLSRGKRNVKKGA